MAPLRLARYPSSRRALHMAGAGLGEQHATIRPKNMLILQMGLLHLLMPCAHPWYPSGNVPAIFLILSAEGLAQRWLLVQEDKQGRAQQHAGSRRYRDEIRPSEDDPKPNPSYEEPQVHRVPHVAIQPDDNQPLRRSNRRRRALSRPTEVPHAA